MDIFTFIKEIEGTNKLWAYLISDIFTQSQHFNNAQIIRLLELIDITKYKESLLQFLSKHNIELSKAGRNPYSTPTSFKKKIMNLLFISKKSKNKFLEELLCLYAMYTMRFQIENETDYDYAYGGFPRTTQEPTASSSSTTASSSSTTASSSILTHPDYVMLRPITRSLKYLNKINFRYAEDVSRNFVNTSPKSLSSNMSPKNLSSDYVNMSPKNLSSDYVNMSPKNLSSDYVNMSSKSLSSNMSPKNLSSDYVNMSI